MAHQTVYGGVRLLGEGPSPRNVARLDHNARPMLHAMAQRGIQIDPDHFRRMDALLTQDMEQMTEEVKQIAGHYINLGSGDQVSQFLFKELGIEQARKKFTKSGKRESVEGDVLVAIQHEHPVVSKILNYKEYEKLRGTYARPIPKLATLIDGRWRLLPHLKDTRVPSGRFCIAKNTPIEILRNVSKFPSGTRIQDVRAGDWAYSYDSRRKLTLKRVLWVGRTVRQARVLRVYWQGDGRHSYGHLDLTANHEVRLVNGEYRRADQLCEGDRVLSLSRAVDAFGYQRLWATGHKEIPKEHRFVYQHIYGWLPEHVHHINGSKSDNRPSNLLGMTRQEHIAEHPPTDYSRYVSGDRMTAYNLTEKIYQQGPNNHKWLGLTREWMIDVLYENRGRPTAFRDVHGIDYATAKKYLKMHGIDWKAIKKECQSTKNHRVTAVEVLPTLIDTYDLEIEGTHNFIAGGLCVHNSCDEPNLLAMPNRTKRGRELLSGFITDPGWTILSVDESQIEPRTVAHRSQDERLMNVYHNREDLYSDFAIGAFKLPDQRHQDDEGKWQYPGVDKKLHRFPSKTCTLASIYRVTNKGLVEQMPVICKHCGVTAADHAETCRGFESQWNEDNCQDIINAFYLRYAGIAPMQRLDDQRAKQHAMTWDAWGRLLHVTAVRSVHPWVVSAALREAGNMPIQGFACGTLKLVMSAVMDDFIREGLYKDSWYPLLPIHDEILQEVREDIAEEVGEHIAYRFKTCVELRVPLAAEWASAPTWGMIQK